MSPSRYEKHLALRFMRFAIQLDTSRVLIFGGCDKHRRFNDLWIFDIKSQSWSIPNVIGEPPSPRAHFTATKISNTVYFYGGYGGYGQVYGDLWALRIHDDGFRWEELTENIEGTGPCPRFDHHCFKYPITPNSMTYDKIIIGGGRDLVQMFHDSYVLDVAEMKWESHPDPPCLPGQVCMNLADDVESVPYHKVFSFGGKTDLMMEFTNKIEVMDCGDLKWRQPLIESSRLPPPRHSKMCF